MAKKWLDARKQPRFVEVLYVEIPPGLPAFGGFGAWYQAIELESGAITVTSCIPGANWCWERTITRSQVDMWADVAADGVGRDPIALYKSIAQGMFFRFDADKHPQRRTNLTGRTVVAGGGEAKRAPQPHGAPVVRGGRLISFGEVVYGGFE